MSIDYDDWFWEDPEIWWAEYYMNTYGFDNPFTIDLTQIVDVLD